MDLPDAVTPHLARLRIKHLTLLELVAVHGSLRKVAAQLHVTQPAVTAMVKDLEAVLGASLVRRDRQGAALTTGGEATRARLRVILNELQAARQANAASTSGQLLRIGVLPVAMIGLVPQAIAALARDDADIAVKLVERTVEVALAQLFDGELDCVIGRVDAKTLAAYPRAAFAFDRLLDMNLQVACGPSHRFARRKSVVLDDLLDESWALLSVDSQLRIAFDQAFIQAGRVPPMPVVESLSFLANFHIVSSSSLLTLAPASAIREFERLRMVRQVALKWPVPLSPLMLIMRRDKGGMRELATFRQVLLACANAMVE